MTEYSDIVNERDEVIGREERKLVHEKKLLHRSVGVIIMNSKKQVLLQLRKASKRSYPSFWSASTAGHVFSGETSEDCAYRETKEELGIEVPLECVGKLTLKDEFDCEIFGVFLGHSDGPFKLDLDEMERVKFFDIDFLKKNKQSLKLTPQVMMMLDLLSSAHKI